MTTNPRQGLTLDQMAKSVNLSIPHLCYLFKMETGISPEHHFKVTRMEHSATLLIATFRSVKEIMFAAGFSDESHFVRDFKKIYGMTPTEYRKSKANGNGHVTRPVVAAIGASACRGCRFSTESRSDRPSVSTESGSDQPIRVSTASRSDRVRVSAASSSDRPNQRAKSQRPRAQAQAQKPKS